MTRPTTVPPIAPGAITPTTPARFGRASTQGVAVAADDSSAWLELAAWLRAGRLERGLSVADVARITKIQARILEDLEAGEAGDLPADVFVRGFVRNIARCVGLSEAEALARYAACSRDAGPVASPAAAAVAELYAPEARRPRMSTVMPVAPGSSAAEVHAHAPRTFARASTSPSSARYESFVPARQSAEFAAARPVEPLLDSPSAALRSAAMAASPAPAVDSSLGEGTGPASAPPPASLSASLTAAPVVTAPGSRELRGSKKKRSRAKRREQRGAHPRAQTVRPFEALEVFEGQPVASCAPAIDEVVDAVAPEVAPNLDVREARDAREALEAREVGAEVRGAWPRAATAAEEPEVWIPKMPPLAAPSRSPTLQLAIAAPQGPTLVIDDADPESASRLQEDRKAERDPTRRTFLPPILLESQDRANRQGGLTLAVIILLIAATLTLSYLMRRPSSAGGGVTLLDSSAQRVG